MPTLARPVRFRARELRKRGQKETLIIIILPPAGERLFSEPFRAVWIRGAGPAPKNAQAAVHPLPAPVYRPKKGGFQSLH